MERGIGHTSCGSEFGHSPKAEGPVTAGFTPPTHPYREKLFWNVLLDLTTWR